MQNVNKSYELTKDTPYLTLPGKISVTPFTKMVQLQVITCMDK